jgi:hypothetical protein
MELADGSRDVVDPEVRAYVSSLVTAVSFAALYMFAAANLPQSLVVVVLMKMVDTYSETTP